MLVQPLSSYRVAPKTRPGAGKRYAAHSALWLICAVLAAISVFTANGFVTSAAFMTLPVLISLLWREGEPPVLLFGCLFQWLQATAAIFYTNHFGQTLDQAFGSNTLRIATWLSIVAVVVLAAGIRLALLNAGASIRVRLENDAATIDINKVAILYGVMFVVSAVLNAFAFSLPSITQPLLAIASLKWAAVFLICYGVIHQQRGYGIMLGCVALEFFSGLFGAFANFKSVFFVLVVAALSSPLAFRGRRLFVTVICFVSLFVMGVVWSAIKVDYRSFLANEETANQEEVPIERKFTKLADLVESLTWDNFNDGIDALVMRVSYVNFFALAVGNVPDRVPYENGALWKGAVVHVLTPRFLFPNKPTLDDSERTNTYTGIQVAGIETGTSIGIGYIGESYVDYGPLWMFAPIFLLGVLYGLIYRCFVLRSRYSLMGSALGVSILIFIAYEIETSNIKLLGGVIAAALVAGVIYRLFGSGLDTLLKRSPALHQRASPSKFAVTRGA